MKKLIQLFILSFIAATTSIAQNSKATEVEELTAATFKQKVWNFDKNTTFDRISKLPLILDFYATWCRPCKMLAPHLHDIQQKYKGKLIVYKIDVDKEPELAKLFKIQAMPTIIYIGSKTNYKTEVGYYDYPQVETFVKDYLFPTSSVKKAKISPKTTQSTGK